MYLLSLNMKRNCAIFTIVKNESFFIDIWLNHYLKFFSKQDIYILDHESEDQSFMDSIKDKANVIKIYNNVIFDHLWLSDTVNSFHSFLLKSYKKILFTEIDELVTVRNGSKYVDLKQYIEEFDGEIARTKGYNVCHFPLIGEGPIDLQIPLLHQRKYWWRGNTIVSGETNANVYWYDKPLLTSIKVEYNPGFHTLKSHEDTVSDPDFLLVHLHSIDIDQLFIRKNSKPKENFASDLKADFHNMPVSKEELENLKNETPDVWHEIIPDDQKNII